MVSHLPTCPGDLPLPSGLPLVESSSCSETPSFLPVKCLVTISGRLENTENSACHMVSAQSG